MKFQESQLTNVFHGINRENLECKTQRSAAEQLKFKRSRSWHIEMSEVPDTRADVVARGKALIADPNYPSRKQLQSVARLLADRMAVTPRE